MLFSRVRVAAQHSTLWTAAPWLRSNSMTHAFAQVV